MPFATQPYLTEAGAASWDWNCDGVETEQRPDVYRCTANGGLPTCPYTAGWSSAVPACGDVATWSAGCTEFPLIPVCYASQTSAVTQGCR